MTDTVMVAEPLALGAGESRRVRSAPEPTRVMLPAGRIAGLFELTVTIKESAGDSASPIVKERSPVDWSSSIVWFGDRTDRGRCVVRLARGCRCSGR